MWKFQETLSYPETAEYLEKIRIEEKSLVDPGYFGPIDFSFRFYSLKKGDVAVIPGLKIHKNKEFTIQTISELDFKIGDMIRFDRDQSKKFKIEVIDYMIENEEEYIHKNKTWPGLRNQVKVKILTLK